MQAHAVQPIPTHPDVIIDRHRTAWSGRFAVDLVDFRHRRFDGALSAPRHWELFRRGRAAALLPYDPWSDQVVVIEQFRLPALVAGFEPMTIEVPAGFCDGAERPEHAARRETHEETGLTPDRLAPMLDVVLTAGGSDERCTLFAGRVRIDAGTAATGLGQAAEQEDIRTIILPAAEAIEQAASGAYPNAVTALALLWLGLRREALRTEWLA